MSKSSMLRPFLILFSVSALCAPIQAAPVVDQAVQATGGLGLVVPSAQSFTVGVSGRLSRIEVELGGRASEIRSYEIGLGRADANGAPTSDWQASYLFSAKGSLVDQPDFSWLSFDLPPIDVQAGDIYLLYLVDTSVLGNFVTRGNAYSLPAEDLYARGQLWVNNGIWRPFRDAGADISFRTFVELSEPATGWLLALALIALSLISRARRTSSQCR